jgi:hypothetical protein
MWDPAKSPAANMTTMGLTSTPNGANATGAKEALPVSENTNVIELFDIPDSDNLEPKTKRIMPLTEVEQTYIANCLAKHGDNYKKIFMDIKTVNEMQHTEKQLRKLASRFFLLDPEQRLVEVPTKVEHLAIKSS